MTSEAARTTNLVLHGLVDQSSVEKVAVTCPVREPDAPDRVGQRRRRRLHDSAGLGPGQIRLTAGRLAAADDDLDPSPAVRDLGTTCARGNAWLIEVQTV